MRFIRGDLNPWAYEGLVLPEGILIKADRGFYVRPVETERVSRVPDVLPVDPEPSRVVAPVQPPAVPKPVESMPDTNILIDLINFAQGVTDVAPPGTLFKGEPVENTPPDIVETIDPPTPPSGGNIIISGGADDFDPILPGGGGRGNIPVVGTGVGSLTPSVLEETNNAVSAVGSTFGGPEEASRRSVGDPVGDGGVPLRLPGPGAGTGGGEPQGVSGLTGAPVITDAGAGTDALAEDDLLSEASKILSSTVGLDPDRTVSAQASEQAAQGEAWAIALCKALDLIDPDHCAKALQNEAHRKTRVGIRACVPPEISREIAKRFKKCRLKQ